jgi:hypothetical protein
MDQERAVHSSTYAVNTVLLRQSRSGLSRVSPSRAEDGSFAPSIDRGHARAGMHEQRADLSGD